MALSIYLNFNGNCREAFEFYRSVFGGEFDNIQTFGDGPGDFLVPADERDHVMHVSLPVGGSVLMGSDTPSWSPEPAKAGNNFAISYAPGTHEEADQLFARISDGGTVTMPARGHVLGRVLRQLHRSVRHQLAAQLRARVARRVARPLPGPGRAATWRVAPRTSSLDVRDSGVGYRYSARGSRPV